MSSCLSFNFKTRRTSPPEATQHLIKIPRFKSRGTRWGSGSRPSMFHENSNPNLQPFQFGNYLRPADTWPQCYTYKSWNNEWLSASDICVLLLVYRLSVPVKNMWPLFLSATVKEVWLLGLSVSIYKL